jgi:hypothetical protein
VSSETQLLDSNAAPTGFTNDAPFKKKAKKKDPAGSALKGIASAGIALCMIAAVLAILSITH